MTLPALQARRRRRGAAERGSVTAELVLLTPLLILILLFVVALGRLASARLQVDTAASEAARAASLARNPAAATQLADQTATATLTGGHLSCAHVGVSVDTADFVPGGWVAVTVTCAVSLADVTGLRLPAAESVSSRFVEPLDLYRGLS